MVSAQEWLDIKIPANQRENVITLQINQQVHCRHNDTDYNNRYSGWKSCDICLNSHQITGQTYQFYNVLLEGKLDLNDFTNLKHLTISGDNQNRDQWQGLIGLKIDKCVELTSLTINYTTLTSLNIDKNIFLQSLNCSNNQLIGLNLTNNSNLQGNLGCSGNRIVSLDISNMRLTNIIKDANTSLHDIQLETELKQTQSQVKRLIEIIKSNNILDSNDKKLEVERIEKENLNYQLSREESELKQATKVVKDHLDESCQEWLETLLETQQEILQKSNSFARKQLERAKKVLTKKLSVEEIEVLLGKTIEINELENQLNNLQIQEAQIEIPPKQN